jgi:hypothetical protein
MRSNKSGLSLPIPPHSMSLLTASISPTTSTSLSYYASPASTPPCTPPVSTLYFNPFLNPPGRGVGQSMTRQSSLSSVCSSNDEGEEDFEWTVEEQDRLREVSTRFLHLLIVCYATNFVIFSRVCFFMIDIRLLY